MCAGLRQEGGDSPEERTLISQFTVPISHVLVDALAEAQLLFLLVKHSVSPHQYARAYDTAHHTDYSSVSHINERMHTSNISNLYRCRGP